MPKYTRILECTPDELNLLRTMAYCTCGDTSMTNGDYAWFGIVDSDFRKYAQTKYALSGKTISGLVSSLVKKGIVEVAESEDYEEGLQKFYSLRDSDIKELKALDELSKVSNT